MSGIQSALISALTAAVVTMFIEFTAKPKLEARKDRILTAARSRREIVGFLGTLNTDVHRFKLAFKQRQYDECDVHISAAMKKYEEIGFRYIATYRTLTAKELTAARMALGLTMEALSLLEAVSKRVPGTPDLAVKEVIDPTVAEYLEQQRLANELATIIFSERPFRSLNYRKKRKADYESLKALTDDHPS